MKVVFVEGRTFEPAQTNGGQWSADVILVMPYLDQAMARRSAELMAARAGTDGLIIAVHDADRRGFIAVANHVFRETQSEYFGYVAQDAYPGRRWLHLAVKALRKQGAALLAFNDGKWQGALAAFGIAERRWASRNYEGEFFFRGYRRHYADVELTVLAISQRNYCYDPNAVLVEVDWNKENASVDLRDKALYLRRKTEGFNRRVRSQVLLDMFC